MFCVSVPYQCQVDGCAEGGTCNHETGECSCPDDGKLYNYNCADHAVEGSEYLLELICKTIYNYVYVYAKKIECNKNDSRVKTLNKKISKIKKI